MNWTSEIPQVSGWYWVWMIHRNTDSPYVIFINENLEYHKYLEWDDEGMWSPVSEYNNDTPYGTLWLGPIDVPTSPLDGNDVPYAWRGL